MEQSITLLRGEFLSKMANPLLKGDKLQVWGFLLKTVEKFCAEFV